MARLKEKYQNELVQKLKEELQLKNVMEVPRVEKVVVNMGLGEAIQNIKILESAAEEMVRITGQKAVITKAKKSIAQFKLREDMPIGVQVNHFAGLGVQNGAEAQLRIAQGVSGVAMGAHIGGDFQKAAGISGKGDGRLDG